MKIFFNILLFISLFTHLKAGSYAKECRVEYKKELFDIVEIKKSCSKAAKAKEESKLYESASWFYLLSGNYKYNTEHIKKFINKKSNVIYSNIGHSYILESNFTQAKEMYLGYLNSSNFVNLYMQDDFKLLLKLYPQHKKELTKGLAIWDELYLPYKEMTLLLSEYPFIIKDTEYKEYKKTDEEKINYLSSIIKQQESKHFKVEKFIQRNARLLFYLYRDMSKIYKRKKEYSKEVFYYSKAIKHMMLYKKSPLQEIQMYGEIVSMYENIKDYNHAIKYYKKIIKYIEKAQGIDKNYKAEAYRYLAGLYHSAGDSSNTIKYYQKSLETSGVDYKWMDKL